MKNKIFSLKVASFVLKSMVLILGLLWLEFGGAMAEEIYPAVVMIPALVGIMTIQAFLLACDFEIEDEINYKEEMEAYTNEMRKIHGRAQEFREREFKRHWDRFFQEESAK